MMSSSKYIIPEIIEDRSFAPHVKKYKRGRLLGKGGFALCYQLESEDSKNVYAGKIIPKSTLNKRGAHEKLVNEIKIHRSVNIPNVVKYYRFFEDKNNVFIVLELCSNQTLMELLKRRKRLTEVETQYFMWQLLRGLKHLHKNNIIHRDLKLGNLFLDSKMNLKLGDFGLATRLDNPDERKRTICGTPNYIAPEILDRSFNGHSFEVDIWSMGVIMYTLIIGKPPFETKSVRSTYRRIRDNDYTFPPHIPISRAAKKLIVQILDKNPAMRPKVADIEKHAFFTQCRIPLSMPDSIKHTPYVPPPIESENEPEKEAKKEKRHSAQPSNVRLGFGIGEGAVRTDGEVWVTQYLDYSSKYGLGYLLSDRSCGAYLNDGSKIILAPDHIHFEYMERHGPAERHTMHTYPPSLKKKVLILDYFRKYLSEVARKNQLENKTPNLANAGLSSAPLVHVRSWLRTKHAVLFRLSSRAVQVTFFDHTEILISHKTRKVHFTDKERHTSKFPIDSVFDVVRHDFAKRMKYTRDILEQLSSAAKGGVESPYDLKTHAC